MHSASIDTEQQHARREWIKSKDGEIVSRGRAKPTCQKPDTQTKHHPPPLLSRVRGAFHREVRVQPYSTEHNHEWELVVYVSRVEAVKRDEVSVRKCD